MKIAWTCAIIPMAWLVNLSAIAQPDTRPGMATLLSGVQAVTYYEETAISPDHRKIAWVQTVPPAADSGSGSAIYLQTLDGKSPPSRVSAQKQAAQDGSTGTENALAWSPDSGSLAFLSDADSPGQAELYVFHIADHSLRRLTSLKGTVTTPRWSPDGRKLALLFTENSERPAGPLVAVPAPTGVIEADTLDQALVLVDVERGAVERLTPANRYVYEFDWSPRSDALVATGAHGSGDNNWYTAELFTVDVATHRERVLLKPGMQIAVPRWAPDGRSIAYVGGLMSDESVASGDVYVIPSDGGTPANLTPALAGSAFSLAWRRDSRAIVLTEARAGGSAVSTVTVRTGKLDTLWMGAETLRATRDALHSHRR